MKQNVKYIKIKQCVGNGMYQCYGCKQKGKWNRSWGCFQYEIAGFPGSYCWDCVCEIDMKVGAKHG